MKDSNSRSNFLPPPGPELTYELEFDDIVLPEIINLIPMAELNSFPQLTSSICVEDNNSRQAVLKSCETDGYLALFAIKSFNVDTNNLTKEDFFPVGVAVRIVDFNEVHENLLKVTIQGMCRISLDEVINNAQGPPTARLSRFPEFKVRAYNIDHLILEARRLFAEVIKLIPGLPINLFKLNQLLEEQPAVLADLIMAALPLKPSLKAQFLLIEDLEERYLQLLKHLTLELSNRRLGQAVTERIEKSLGRRQKELQLREQIKAIRAELGEENEEFETHRDLADKLAGTLLPAEVRPTVDREFQRLKNMPPQSSESCVILNFLDWIVALPWNTSTEETADLKKARQILDRDHYGLTKVKQRLLEFLAVHKLTKSHKAPLLCLTGPPGVGKTSLGRSVAEALDRKFVRLSLGGLRDEAEIRGHRRTYVGARPGRIIAGLKKAGVNNPVFLLDEIDKLGTGPTGDPAAALLEVLDPEQNETFTDNFLEVPFDLSNVLFILTANVLEHIPGPLRDRLEIIEVDGYTLDEKMNIARRHLWPKELDRHGLTISEVEVTDEALENIVCSYTWETGCRELGRQLGALARSRAVAKAEAQPLKNLVEASELEDILGLPKRQEERREKMAQTGVVTGLAWTPGGGDIMFVEAVAMPGQGGVSLTGQLGEVMKESAQAAVSYVRSRSNDWLFSDDWFKEHDLHIHLPHGAIPKDGPSAGVALATAVVSLVSGFKVKPDLAMTGEISLRGLVLPVGGLKEKLLAAKRAGLSTVLVPALNQPELARLPKSIAEGLNIVPVTNLDQVLEQALITGEKLAEGEVFNPLDKSETAPSATPPPPWLYQTNLGPLGATT
ncbi:MAG: endopeptidase La [Deltaproteobacteria bacterium]|jgi:ATP-dependent Lon protease|nr:endopeptidase La [Deltaproteobacteria bacterium]